MGAATKRYTTFSHENILFTCKEKQDGRVKYISAFYIMLFGQLQAIIQSVITVACSMRYMPYATHHVYSLLKIEKCSLSNIFVIDLFHYSP